MRRASTAPLTAAAVILGVALSACTDNGSADTSATTGASRSGPTSPSTTASPNASTTSSAARPTATAGASTGGSAACVASLNSRLTTEQRIGQLVMIGLDANAHQAALDREITAHHLGNVIYLGGWDGAARVRDVSAHLQDLATPAATGGVQLFIAADQEGGAVQQLKGDGFDRLPSALVQGRASTAQRTAYAKTIGTQLKSAGVNLNLAPVADTVPTAIGTGNEPIGKYGREYSHDPTIVGAAVTDIVRGLTATKVASTVKHFPGLGRISRNTDFYATGITDSTTTANNEYLQPFQAGIAAGADMVMMSSARYSKLDATNQAVFSPAIIQGLLRTKLGYDGVVVTDDLNAVAVRNVPIGQRAVRFIEAGGDIALTGSASAGVTMATAIGQKYSADKQFAAKVDASVKRVLAAKVRLGLARCAA